jgi:hypothetical protein
LLADADDHGVVDVNNYLRAAEKAAADGVGAGLKDRLADLLGGPSRT